MGEVSKFSNQLPRDGLLADYRPPAGVFDEMVAPAGLLRSPWEQFIGGVQSVGPAVGLTQRAEQVKRLLRESGVTYNVVGAPQGPDRPWELDPLPLLFDKPAGNRWPRAGAARDLAEPDSGRCLRAAAAGPRRRFAAGGGLRASRLFAAVSWNSPTQMKPVLCLYAAHLARQPDGSGWC